MKNITQAGFARLDITPPLGICSSGYFDARYACGILDPLEAHESPLPTEKRLPLS